MRDECLLVSVKKTKKDTQTEEHKWHSESAITQVVLVKKTKEDMRTEEYICDWLCENPPLTHIQFYNFNNP